MDVLEVQDCETCDSETCDVFFFFAGYCSGSRRRIFGRTIPFATSKGSCKSGHCPPAEPLGGIFTIPEEPLNRFHFGSFFFLFVCLLNYSFWGGDVMAIVVQRHTVLYVCCENESCGGGRGERGRGAVGSSATIASMQAVRRPHS